MKIKWNKKYNIIAVYATVVLCAAITFYFVMSNISYYLSWLGVVWGIVRPIVYGMVIAYLINPVMELFETFVFSKFIDKPSTIRGVSVGCAYVVVVLVFVLLFYFIIPQLATSVSTLFQNSKDYMKNLESWGYSTLQLLKSQGIITLGQMNEYSKMLENWVNVLVTGITNMMPQILDTTKQVTVEVFNFVIGFFISFYILFGKEKFASQTKRVLYSFIPQKTTATIFRVVGITNNAFSSFIKGKVLDALIMGILCFIGTTILGIPYAILISTLVGVCNIIPYFGPFFGAIPSIFIILLIDPTKALWLTIFLIILQQFEGNILGPRILGQSTGIGAFWIITAIIVGGGLWGVIGMFIGIPVFTVLYELFREVVHKRLKTRGFVDEGDEEVIIYGGIDPNVTDNPSDDGSDDGDDMREW